MKTPVKLLLATSALGLILALGACSTPAQMAVSRNAAVPLVIGPIPNQDFGATPKNYEFFATDIALESRGYVEREYFMQGKANAYDAPAVVYTPTLIPKRLANVVKADIPYKTRIVVRRPVDPAKFNGTVLVEWLNVTDGIDGKYFWVQAKDYLIRAGYAYVGISAQDNSISVTDRSLKKFSPTRYGSLDVTGEGKIANDDLSYDIFSQAAQVAKNDPQVLGGMPVQKIIGIGMSQSGIRFGNYLNYIHMKAPVYDAFLVQVWNPSIRDDMTTPVIKVMSESEANSTWLAVAQEDTPTRHSWWVAGTSHGDQTQRFGRTGVFTRDLGATNVKNDACATGAPTRPRTPLRHVINSAIYHLQMQIKSGAIPPSGPAFTTAFKGASISIVRDANGNALGGIRMASSDVPVARADGLDCGGFIGAWVPFTEEKLKSLYATHADYVGKVIEAANRSVKAGFILPEDAAQTVAEARASTHGLGIPCGPLCLSAGHATFDFSSTGLLRDNTLYYDVRGGELLLSAVDNAHLEAAKGYAEPVKSLARREHFQAAVVALQKYMGLVDSAKSEQRLTATAASVLVEQARNIIKGLIEG